MFINDGTIGIDKKMTSIGRQHYYLQTLTHRPEKDYATLLRGLYPLGTQFVDFSP
jgi:hypothetical protein